MIFDQLKSIAKPMRYFDDINDFASFIENKGKKNEIVLKKEQNDLLILKFHLQMVMKKIFS